MALPSTALPLLGLLGEKNPNAQQLAYDELAAMRAMEQRRAAQGVDTSPVDHWTQGAARVAQALFGALRRGQLDNAERERNDWANGLISDAMSAASPDAVSAATALPPDIAPQPVAQDAPPPAGATEAPATPPGFDWSTYAVNGATRPDSFTGMNQDFSGGLQRLISEAPPEIRDQLRVSSGYRSPERQAQLWQGALAKYGSPEAARRWVAPPGRSQHNHGNAADLKFLSPDAMAYAHENASRYGLAFPLDNENWHVELAGARGGAPQPGAAPDSAGQPATAFAPQDGGNVRVAGGTPQTDTNALLMALAQRGGAVPMNGAAPPQAGAMPSAGAASASAPAPAMPSPPAAPLAAGSAPQAAPQGQQAVVRALAGADPRLVQALASGRLSPEQTRVAQMLVQQQIEQNDPMRKLQLERAQLENDRLRRPPRRELMNVGDGRLYDPNSGQWITAPNTGSTAPQTVEAFDPETGQPVRMQWNRDKGQWENLGGAKKPAARPIPAAVQAAEAGDLEDIQTLGGVNDMLSRFNQQIAEGKLSLGPVQNVVSGVQNALGASDENSRNYQSFRSGLEKMRNDSLRLNKGVQTEGDAQRAWNELLDNINDPAVVQQRLAEIQDINRKAVQFKYGLIDNRRTMNGLDALDPATIITSPSGRQGPPPAGAGAGAGAGTATQGAATPPPAALEALRQNPALSEQFDAKYGAGAAARALGR